MVSLPPLPPPPRQTVGVSFSDWLGYGIIRAKFGYILERYRVPKHSDFHRQRTSTTTLNMANFANMWKHFNLGSGRMLFAQERFRLQNQDLRQSVRELLNREIGFIRLRYRRGTERYLRNPYEPAAKVSTSHRWRLQHHRVCKLQVCRHQVGN